MAKLRAMLCISFCSSLSPAEISTEVTGAGAPGDSREEEGEAEEDIRQDLPAEELPEQQRFSLQTAWLVVKRVARGHIVKLTCSGRQKIWLHYSPEVPWEIRRTTNNNLDQEIFKGRTLDSTNFPIENF